jgi:hypothetical protein
VQLATNAGDGRPIDGARSHAGEGAHMLQTWPPAGDQIDGWIKSTCPASPARFARPLPEETNEQPTDRSEERNGCMVRWASSSYRGGIYRPARRNRKAVVGNPSVVDLSIHLEKEALQLLELAGAAPPALAAPLGRASDGRPPNHRSISISNPYLSWLARGFSWSLSRSANLTRR